MLASPKKRIKNSKIMIMMKDESQTSSSLSTDLFIFHTLFVHSAQTICNIALLNNIVFAKINLEIAFSTHLRASILKDFLRPKHGGPYGGLGIRKNI